MPLAALYLPIEDRPTQSNGSCVECSVGDDLGIDRFRPTPGLETACRRRIISFELDQTNKQCTVFFRDQ